MQTLGGIAGLLYALGLVVLGVVGSPVWTPAIGALIGVAVYHLVRPQARMHEAELWHAGHAWGIAKLLTALYVMQLLLAAILYGLGRAIGYFL